MGSVLTVIIATLIIMGIGGGGAYLLFLKTRPKKIVWKANIYQIGEGIHPPTKDKEGNVVCDIKLSDLRPYTTDTVEKIERGEGLTIYQLVKLKRPLPDITSDCVDYWGENNREVSILKQGETYTLLKKGYNVDAGVLFQPMAHDRINMIVSQIATRKERLKKEKDILQAISPWVVTGICMLGLVALTYFVVDGFMDIAETIGTASVESARLNNQAVDQYRDLLAGKLPQSQNLGVQEIIEPPPLVEDG